MKLITILTAMIVLALVTVGCTTVDSAKDKAIMEKQAMAEKEAMEQKEAIAQKEAMTEKVVEEQDAMTEKSDTVMTKDEYKGAILAGTTTPYLDFTKEDYDKALAKNKVIVLNFYASWCPTCKAEHPEAVAAFSELNLDNVVGFRVHYKDDFAGKDETELAKQFGIPYQHTKVIIKNGERVLKAPDSWDKQRYITEITKYA